MGNCKSWVGGGLIYWDCYFLDLITVIGAYIVTIIPFIEFLWGYGHLKLDDASKRVRLKAGCTGITEIPWLIMVDHSFPSHQNKTNPTKRVG